MAPLPGTGFVNPSCPCWLDLIQATTDAVVHVCTILLCPETPFHPGPPWPLIPIVFLPSFLQAFAGGYDTDVSLVAESSSHIFC